MDFFLSIQKGNIEIKTLNNQAIYYSPKIHPASKCYYVSLVYSVGGPYIDKIWIYQIV